MIKPVLRICLLLYAHYCGAQSLPNLLQRAERNFPLLKAKVHEVAARSASVAGAKSTLMPTLDVAYQLNYATYNNKRNDVLAILDAPEVMADYAKSSADVQAAQSRYTASLDVYRRTVNAAREKGAVSASEL